MLKGNTEESTYIFTCEYLNKRLFMSQQPKFYNTYITFSVHEAKDLPIKECHSSPNFMPCSKSFRSTKRNFVSLHIIICLQVGFDCGTLCALRAPIFLRSFTHKTGRCPSLPSPPAKITVWEKIREPIKLR